MKARILLISSLIYLAPMVLTGQDITTNPSSFTETELVDFGAPFGVNIHLDTAYFLDNSSLSISDISIADNPGGLTITGFSGVDTNDATVTLSFTPGDFDIDYPNCHFVISMDVFSYPPSTDRQSNNISITANVETASLASGTYGEVDINGAEIRLTLGGNEEFISNSTLETTDFSLSGFPPGVSITNLSSNHTTYVDLHFTYDFSDFDITYTDCRVVVNDDVLLFSSAGLSTAPITISHRIESVEMTDSYKLYEPDLNDGWVEVTLTNDEFIDDDALTKDDFELIGFPPGTATQDPGTQHSSVYCRVPLSFTPKDFDFDYTNAQVRVKGNVLKYNAADLTTPAFTVRALYDPPDAVITAPTGSLSEQDVLDDPRLTISLVNETFTDYTTLSGADFKLEGISSPGLNLSVDSAVGLSNIQAYVYLSNPDRDFDDDYNYFHLTINPAVLTQTTSWLPTDTLAIVAYVETPEADINPGSPILSEYKLDGRTLTLTLTEEEFDNFSTFDRNDVDLVNNPSSVSIVSASASNKNTATILLSKTREDLDVAFTMGISIHGDALLQTESGNLASNQLAVGIVDEHPSARITPDQQLKEYSLNGRVLSVKLDQEEFWPNAVFGKEDVHLNNAPPNLGILSAVRTGDSTATITLSHTVNDLSDFDDNIDLSISIEDSVLFQSATNLSSSASQIQAYTEIPQAPVTVPANLREYWLGTAGQSVSLKFIDEKFIGTPVKGDFTLVGAPPGLNVASISAADSSVILNLLFTGADYDIEYPDVFVEISSSILLHTESGTLATGTFDVHPNIEPNVSKVEILNQSMKVGDIVDVKLTVDDDRDSTYTLKSGSIGGYSLKDLSREPADNTTYYASFEVTRNGNDYLADVDIPVRNLVLIDGPIQGHEHNSEISQNADLLDAHLPEIGSLTVLGSGNMSIGDEVVIIISAFETKLRAEDSCVVNGISLSPGHVDFVELGGGTYTLTYTIKNNDPGVTSGNLEAKVYLTDIAGNVNDVVPALVANNVAIDATAPLITKVENTTLADKVIIGETVTLTVTADSPDYLLDPATVVNGVSAEKLEFVNMTPTTYEIRYTVEEGDDVASQIRATVILKDIAGNSSDPATTILNNGIDIFTLRPTALLTGADEICVGDTAVLYVTMKGQPPFKIRYSDLNGSYDIPGITNKNYLLKLDPEETMNISIDNVTDGTGNIGPGEGNSLITVHPLPEPQIQGLASVYSVQSAPAQLFGVPDGGDFKGPGINTATNTFNPNVAGETAGIPHQISYTYTDQYQCVNTATHAVNVIAAQASIEFPGRINACYFERDFSVVGYNIFDTTGWFTTTEILPPGFLVDNNDNTATINPDRLDWSDKSNIIVTLNYYYDDTSGVHPFASRDLEIDFEEPPVINAPDNNSAFCSDTDPIEFIGNKGNQGTFEGPGVLNLGGNDFIFRPNESDTGLNMIYYTHITAMQCEQKDSITLIVFETPDPKFIILDTCISSDKQTVHFENLTDTTGISKISWLWQFDDFLSGDKNADTVMNPSHDYRVGGLRTISLSATSADGCESNWNRALDFGDKPGSFFTANTECFTDDPIIFTQEASSLDEISDYKWTIYDLEGNKLASANGKQMEEYSYKFLSRNNYRVELQVTTMQNCRDEFADTIYLRPYIQNLTADEPYIQGFEGQAEGWVSDYGLVNQVKSWKVEDLTGSKFPYSAAEGSKAWFTQIADRDKMEQSWVESPCYNFSNLRRPMVSMDIKRSFERDRDGAALQYTTNNGKSWNNVGAINDGSINWYNSFRIQNGPGGQGEGWTGEFTFVEDQQWLSARHEMDELIGEPLVQFRIAYGSDGSSVELNNGFAFDNFRIGERSRLVLMEHFTHSSDALSGQVCNELNKLVWNNRGDVIDLQYHVELTGLTDRMNKDNPGPASARQLYYGDFGVPLTLLDGGNHGTMTYDYTGTPLDTLDLYTEALKSPQFEIDMETEISGGVLSVNLDFEALEDIPSKEVRLFVAVIEKKIDDPSYTGTNGEIVFQNVVRNMLPYPAGISYNHTWKKGDKKTESFNWTLKNILNDEMVYVVAFLQNDDSKLVYQAATNDPDVLTVSVKEYMSGNGLNMLLYPNPATERAFLMFPKAVHGAKMQLFNQQGKLVSMEEIQNGTELFEIDLSGFTKGVYLLRVIQQNRVLGTEKLLIQD